jgi:hypothetical protein
MSGRNAEGKTGCLSNTSSGNRAANYFMYVVRRPISRDAACQGRCLIFLFLRSALSLVCRKREYPADRRNRDSSFRYSWRSPNKIDHMNWVDGMLWFDLRMAAESPISKLGREVIRGHYRLHQPLNADSNKTNLKISTHGLAVRMPLQEASWPPNCSIEKMRLTLLCRFTSLTFLLS